MGRTLGLAVGYLIVFLALEWLCATKVMGDTVIRSWYLPNGVSLALLVLGGPRFAPLVALATLAGALWLRVPGAFPIALALAVATTAGYTLAAHMLRGVARIDPRLARFRDVINFTLVGGIAGSLVVGALNALALALFGRMPWSDYAAAVSTWWNGDIVGMLAVTPFLLVVGARWMPACAPADGDAMMSLDDDAEIIPSFPSWRTLLNGACWLALIAFILWATTYLQVMQNLHLSYLSFLLVIWMGLQYGTLGTSAGALAFSAGLLVMTVLLPRLLPNIEIADTLLAGSALPEWLIFIMTLSLTGLLMGAVVGERRRSEAELRSREELLSTLINAMPDVVVFKDGGGAWLTTNMVGKQFFGLLEQDYHGKTDEVLSRQVTATGSLFTTWGRTDNDAWQHGTPHRDEETVAQPDGDHVFDIIKVPLFHTDGRRKGLVLIGRDITERVRAEQALQQERAYLSSAIDILPLPLAFLSTAGEWMQANAAGHAFVPGMHPRQWLDAEMLTAETRQPISREDRPVARALRGEVLNASEVLLVRPDGHEVPVLVHAGPVVVNEQMAAVVIAFQDITALKEADRAKDNFLGVLSHELLTPLNDILGWTQAGRDSVEVTGQALEIIEHNARLLNHIMTDLLDLSRIIHGKLYLNRQRAELWALLEDDVNEFMPMATGRRRTVTLEPPDDELIAIVDHERLHQVISTLLAHALKNTAAGDDIVISAYREGNTGVLVIRDTGRGIPADMLLHLFTPFHPSQPVEPGRGLGLGLALAKGIVELHGGRIMADSDGPGAGSVFTVELPLKVIEEL